ncbi:MAG TPA: hypothetical protein VN028_04250 [Rhodocyclaceae bacterium]|nr:hypothetical protein [Rhodocyclaceae bacterium]
MGLDAAAGVGGVAIDSTAGVSSMTILVKSRLKGSSSFAPAAELSRAGEGLREDPEAEGDTIRTLSKIN